MRTVTHARLRAEQGDVRSARRILLEILAGDPEHAAARRLLDEIAGRCDIPASDGCEPALEPRRPARASDLARRFRLDLGSPTDARRRIRRLERWLGRVARGDA